MSQLIINLPSQKVWVRKEYLRDLKDGFGEFVEGVLGMCKSIPGRAFYFETYLPEYGAMFDKLPISAFLSRPETPTPDLDLLTFSSGTAWTMALDASRSSLSGQWTSRYAHAISDPSRANTALLWTIIILIQTLQTTMSEVPDEHKSHNCIELENGQFCLYPNNRTRIYDLSITPENPKTPDL